MLDVLHVSLDNPKRDLLGTQAWGWRARKSGAGSDPTLTVTLYERGIALRVLLAPTPISDEVIFSETWDSSLLSESSGEWVAAQFVVERGEDGASVDLASLQWNPLYAPFEEPFSATFLVGDSLARSVAAEVASATPLQRDSMAVSLAGQASAKSLAGDSRAESV